MGQKSSQSVASWTYDVAVLWHALKHQRNKLEMSINSGFHRWRVPLLTKLLPLSEQTRKQSPSLLPICLLRSTFVAFHAECTIQPQHTHQIPRPATWWLQTAENLKLNNPWGVVFTRNEYSISLTNLNTFIMTLKKFSGLENCNLMTIQIF